MGIKVSMIVKNGGFKKMVASLSDLSAPTAVQTVQPNPKWCFPITTATHCEYTAGACTNGWECRQQHRAAHTGLHTECMVNEVCRQ